MEEAIKKLEEMISDMDSEIKFAKQRVIEDLNKMDSDYPVDYADEHWRDFRTCMETKIALEAALTTLKNEN